MSQLLTRRSSIFTLLGTSGFVLPALLAFAQTRGGEQEHDFGLLVMAHGGGPTWNRKVEAMLAPPRGDYHVEIAFGMANWRINTNAAFALTTQGLAEAPEIGAVLAERARALSGDVRQESVLIIAHGPADDAENHRWLAHIDARCGGAAISAV